MMTLVGLLAAAYLVAGLMTRQLYPAEHLGECTHGQGGSAALCGLEYGDPAHLFLGFMHGLAASLWLLPLLIGMFLAAAPTAREFETGTLRWTFTQGISRRRWLVTTASAVLVPGLSMAVVFQLGYQFWQAPLGEFYGQLGQGRGFGLGPLAMPALTVFTAAFGLLAASALRRLTATIAVTLLGWYLVSFGLGLLRPRYLAPLLTEGRDAPTRADWRIATKITDATGAEVSLDEAYARASRLRPVSSGGNADHYFAEAGLIRWVEYQPADRFWTFQFIEAGILLVLTGLSLAGAWLLVRRRP
ncbi:hypothetical protein UA74_25765 [Actinoalloteichus fjordicus]|uniref:Uncharacterized protein n=2 Tax=Pseudonocardiaceae TaxID=2070 RepID=A0AAC9LHT7_9PSEU|nr:hypothetical protein UA74_25765 [Actinoalloteichus fjordicus]